MKKAAGKKFTAHWTSNFCWIFWELRTCFRCVYEEIYWNQSLFESTSKCGRKMLFFPFKHLCWKLKFRRNRWERKQKNKLFLSANGKKQETFIPGLFELYGFLVFTKLNWYMWKFSEKNSLCKYHRRFLPGWRKTFTNPLSKRSSLRCRVLIYGIFIPSSWKWIHFVWFYVVNLLGFSFLPTKVLSHLTAIVYMKAHTCSFLRLLQCSWVKINTQYNYRIFEQNFSLTRYQRIKLMHPETFFPFAVGKITIRKRFVTRWVVF